GLVLVAAVVRFFFFFFFSSRRRHTRFSRDWSSDVCSSDLHGMMLSEREMELSDEHTGILELDPEAPVGARFVDVHPFDPVFEIAVTPNRPDALAVAGIARDLAARGLGRLITPAIEKVPGRFPCPIGVY